MDLSYNRLAQIDSGTFKGLPRMVYLDLSHNSQLSLETNGGSFQGLEYTLLHLVMDNVTLSMVSPLLNQVILGISKLLNLSGTNITNSQFGYTITCIQLFP